MSLLPFVEPPVVEALNILDLFIVGHRGSLPGHFGFDPHISVRSLC